MKINNYTTPLIKLDKELTGIQNCYIKDESKNPYGTLKDRRSFVIFEEAKKYMIDKISVITSGNNGYSLARVFENSGIKIVCLVSEHLKQTQKDLLKKYSYKLIELNLEHKFLRDEEIIMYSREKDQEVIWNATNGYDEAYGSIVKEITSEIKPDYIIVPIGSGGIFAGIVNYINHHNLKIHVIGVGVKNTSNSLADKLTTPWTPYEKLLENNKEGFHKVIRINEIEVSSVYEKFKNIIDCEPSSAVVFSALDKIQFNKNDKVVFVNSGMNRTFKN